MLHAVVCWISLHGRVNLAAHIPTPSFLSFLLLPSAQSTGRPPCAAQQGLTEGLPWGLGWQRTRPRSAGDPGSEVPLVVSFIHSGSV